jgi:hypothetical protein
MGVKVVFQLRDVITSGFQLLCQPLRGFQGLPGIMIGRICCLMQEIQSRVTDAVDRFEAIIAGIHTAV